MGRIIVPYSFYKETYRGATIPEVAFSMPSFKGEALINIITFGRIRNLILKPDDLEAVQFAICAAAEVYHQDSSRQSGVKTESNDGFSVSYDDKTTDQRAAEAASVFLGGTTLQSRCLDYDY